MPLLLAILFGALADGTCAHDSEDNVCLLALNSSRSRLEANADVTAAVSGDPHNTTDLSLAGGNVQKGLGATLGTMVSDYRARGASNRSAGNRSSDAARVQSSEAVDNEPTHGEVKSDSDHSGEPTADTSGVETSTDEETGSVSITLEHAVAPEFQERLQSSSGSAYANNVGMSTKKTLNQPPLSYAKSGSGGKQYWENGYADELAAKFGQNISDHSPLSTSFSSSASELQTVLKAMYNLGRLIKRMPDDRLETRKETPAPTPPPYAFARRFEPFGKGTSTI